VPIVQAKLLGTDAVNPIFVVPPLQILAVFAVVTIGFGLTVTVMVYGFPGHEPVLEVGVTKYGTLPTVVLLGLVRVWLIVLPDPELAPVIPPVMVPIVQL
jgi:hypothetical protein